MHVTLSREITAYFYTLLDDKESHMWEIMSACISTKQLIE